MKSVLVRNDIEKSFMSINKLKKMSVDGEAVEYCRYVNAKKLNQT